MRLAEVPGTLEEKIMLPDFKKSSTEIKANVSNEEPQRGFAYECREGVKLDLRLLKKKKKKKPEGASRAD